MVDDDEGLRRRCLPIDDYVESQLPLPQGPPSSGLEYLRMVRLEANTAPQVVVAAQPPPSHTPTSFNDTSTTHSASTPNSKSDGPLDVRAVYFGKLNHETQTSLKYLEESLPEHLRMDEEWVNNVVREFGELREALAEDWKRRKIRGEIPVLPGKRPKNAQEWYQFWYGSNGDQKESSAAIEIPMETEKITTNTPISTIPPTLTPKAAVEEVDEEEEEGELQELEDGELDESEPQSPTLDPLPLLSLATLLDTPTSLQILQHHLHWLPESALPTPFTLQLLFALLTRLHTPLLPNQTSILRDLVRKLKRSRARFLKSLEGVSKEDPGLLGISMIVGIISIYFGQRDLCDPKPTPTKMEVDEGLSKALSRSASISERGKEERGVDVQMQQSEGMELEDGEAGEMAEDS
ncbi:hypothetical protein HDV05_004124 [Chytridiales sp. JEL 0842]|nr:hypothetical protein HDV05_004124 [Chytridiales sp. JEL 0842]